VREMLRPMSVGIGATAVVVALVIAANIWPRFPTVAVPSAASTPSSGALAGAPNVDLILHSWERPLPVTPGLDRWKSGFLSLASGHVDYGTEPGPAASRSAVVVANLDTLAVTATNETRDCAIGNIGTYRWSLEGKNTVMMLTSVSPDACAAREQALTGTWVRSDLPVSDGSEPALPPGTYWSSAFDPLGKPGTPRQLSYTVPEGWKIVEDLPGDIVLHHLSDAAQGQASTDTFIALFAQPGFVAVDSVAPCGASSDGPRVGQGVKDIAVAIIAQDGVVSTPPTAVTIGGYEGQILDLQVASSWTGGCRLSDGKIASVPFLLRSGPGTGPTVGVDPDHPLRLILLDLTGGRTMAVAIFGIGPAQPLPLKEQVAAAMPIIESFAFLGAAEGAPSGGDPRLGLG
jgi:hypothetical protein